MGTRRLTPVEVGIEDVNLKVTTDNNSKVFDVRQAFAFTAIIDITETGSPTTGTADLIVDIMTRDGATETLSHAIDVGMDIKVNGLKEAVAWGHGITAAVISTGTKGTISATPGVLANVDKQVAPLMETYSKYTSSINKVAKILTDKNGTFLVNKAANIMKRTGEPGQQAVLKEFANLFPRGADMLKQIRKLNKQRARANAAVLAVKAAVASAILSKFVRRPVTEVISGPPQSGGGGG